MPAYPIAVMTTQVMGDKGFIEKNFQRMKDTMEADKEAANREADEQEGGGDGAEDVPGARRKRGALGYGRPCARRLSAACALSHKQVMDLSRHSHGSGLVP